ncbi:MAG: phosphoribosylglycinamide formyltransferase [Oscillospiraceae bacterium]|nr:phosphoribosylglycinamide formyltransferase [Oscillospiraceae bacterium]
MKKIAVLVSGGGTNLQALIDAQKTGVLKSGRICLVVSSKPGAYALTRAASERIPTETLDIAEYPDRNDYSRRLAEIVSSYEADLVVLAGFMVIFTPEFIERFENRIINVHPSLIPSFCGEGFYGLRVHRAALDRGVKVSGATVHFVNSVTDGGPIILQKAVEVREDDTPETLQQRIMREAEWKLLPQAAELFCSGRISVLGCPGGGSGKVYISEAEENKNK